jgi:hypothetical protein
MKFGALLASTVLTLFCAATVHAQVVEPPPASPDPGDTALEDITVVGAAMRRATATYARTIGVGPPGRLSPRWNDRICVRVMNMDAQHAAFLKDRVETVARALNLSPDASPTCRPNISIYASNDPDALATALVEAAPRNFRPVRNNVSLGDEALGTFRTSDAPVRWWQVSLPLMVDTGQPAIVLGATESRKDDPIALAVTVRNGSRLRGNVRDDLLGVTIIVDTAKVNGVPFEAVSDYVAFVALAPADPRATTEAFETVLNLFDQTGVTGLTLMDQDYLYALYTTSRAPASAGLQAAEIADRMMTERQRRSAEN